MMWATHAAFALPGLYLLYTAEPQLTSQYSGALVTAVIVGSLLPDLDAPDSKLQRGALPSVPVRPFQLLAFVVRRSSPHRGWTHSLRGLIIFGLVAGLGIALSTDFASAALVWIAFTGGYASHLLADMMNPSGIPLLYPQPRRYHLLPKGWRVPTGSPEEEIVFASFACLSLAVRLRFMNGS